jgi:cytochrome c biogenesis protein CcmG/thiol:disulfide interchange protein DsbE
MHLPLSKSSFKLFTLLIGLVPALLPHGATASPAPNFSLPDIAGNIIELDAQQARVVYLDFWASWCGPCRQSFPWMNEMLQKYQGQGLEIIAVNLDSAAEDAEKFLAKTPAQFTVLYDHKGITPGTFGVKGMPTSFLIDANGEILSQHAGFNSAHKQDLETAIRKALELE